MNLVHVIFDAFNEGAAKAAKGASVVAAETGVPMKTVWSWKDSGEIPPWRRPAVAEAARRKKLDLPDAAWLYLASAERATKAA